MSYRQVLSVLVIVFVIVLIQSTLAGPLVQLEGALTGVADLSNPHFDGESLISGMFSSWFNVGLVAIFLLIGVTVARVLRRELTRRRSP
jgi:ABC-type Fe3+ transport system permease subunit